MCERSRSFGILSTLANFNISGPRKDNACCLVFVFRRDIFNSICDLVLYLLYERLTVSLMVQWYNPVLKAVVAMQDFTLQKLRTNLLF